MAATTKASPAPAAAEDETIEVTLPEDFLLEPEEEGDEPDAKPEAEEPAKDEPAKVEDTKPEPDKDPEPDPKVEAKDDEPLSAREKQLLARAKEDRDKRKEYARLYAEAKDQLEETERRFASLSGTPDPERDPNLKKYYDDLIKEAEGASDLALPLKLSIKDADRRDRAMRRELNAMKYQITCDFSEVRARLRHPDWEAVVKKSGVFDAVAAGADGQFKDPAIGNRVYYNADKSLTADPAERMYRLGVGKLEYDRQQKGEPEPELEVERDVNAYDGVRNGAVKDEGKDLKKVEAEAETRGANKVIAAVAKNSTRLQGVRNLPKAGDGPTRMSRKHLDNLMESNPGEYERLMRKNPELERFHLG